MWEFWTVGQWGGAVGKRRWGLHFRKIPLCMVETAVGGDESGACGARAAEIHREMMAS